jgi:hypothetical protein
MVTNTKSQPKRTNLSPEQLETAIFVAAMRVQQCTAKQRREAMAELQRLQLIQRERQSGPFA